MSLEEDLAIAKRWKQKAEQIENSRRKVLKKRALRNEDIANNNYFSVFFSFFLDHNIFFQKS